jgi:hypothetical protein
MRVRQWRDSRAGDRYINALASALYSRQLPVVVGLGTTIADRPPSGDSVQTAVAGWIPALVVAWANTDAIMESSNISGRASIGLLND